MRITTTDLDNAEKAKVLIEKEYYKQYSLRDLAHQVGTNVSKLQVAFKMVAGLNLYEYHSQVRVEKAAYLLENTELTIEVIARKVGLDRSNLNKQFKKIHFVCPSKWREEQEKIKRQSRTIYAQVYNFQKK